MRVITIVTSIITAIKAVWFRGSPFAAVTALYPTNEEGKYVIQAEGIRLAFTTHAGALANLWINDTNGNELDIVMGFDNPDDYLRHGGNPYLNGVIGRYAGVINNAQFNLDNKTHQLSSNGRQGDTWNGGGKGWGRTTLDIASHSENSITFVMFDRAWNGFPGTMASSLTHTVTPYEWHIAYGVTPIRARSPINLSHQVFWNLNGFTENTNRTISDHHLHLPFSGMRIDTDARGVPTGDLRANREGSAFDFWSKPKVVDHGLRQNQECGAFETLNYRSEGDRYDETFIISRLHPWKKEDYPVATLSSAHSGIRVNLYTDQEALHVHTWGNGQVPLKKAQGFGDVPQHGAISMEMQEWPDGINHPEWQRKEKSVFGTDNLYTSFSSFKFSVDRKGVAT